MRKQYNKSGHQTIDISVIVPIHNAEAVLKDCLQSIEQQKFDGGFEVIMIEDRSDGNSARIAWQFCKSRANQFRFMQNQQTIGTAASKKRGLDLARGTHIMFVDPGESLPETAFTLFFEAAVADNRQAHKTAS